MDIISFCERVNIAVDMVWEKYPGAKVYEVQGLPSEGPVDDPNGIDELTIIFDNNDNIPNTTIKIESIGYSEFSEPELVNDIYYGNTAFDWPVEMDLDEAHRLKDAAGYTEPYLAVTLRELLGPKKVNPRFIFAFGNKDTGKPYVFVDTVTKEVGIYSE